MTVLKRPWSAHSLTRKVSSPSETLEASILLRQTGQRLMVGSAPAFVTASLTLADCRVKPVVREDFDAFLISIAHDLTADLTVGELFKDRVAFDPAVLSLCGGLEPVHKLA